MKKHITSIYKIVWILKCPSISHTYYLCRTSICKMIWKIILKCPPNSHCYSLFRILICKMTWKIIKWRVIFCHVKFLTSFRGFLLKFLRCSRGFLVRILRFSRDYGVKFMAFYSGFLVQFLILSRGFLVKFLRFPGVGKYNSWHFSILLNPKS